MAKCQLSRVRVSIPSLPTMDLMDSTTTFYCSNCRKQLSADQFDLNKAGIQKKTCRRHTKKRKRSIHHDDWDEFATFLSQSQSYTLNHTFKFDLDALSVKFGSELDKDAMRVAMHDLSTLIWNESGFRFRHTSTAPQYHRYEYHCSQDEAYIQRYQSKIEKNIDGRRMERFACGSKLIMQPSLLDRTLRLSIQHHWHPPYKDIQVPQAIRNLIDSLVFKHTPAEISRQVRGHPEGKEVSRHQVYYIWQKANSKNWRRHDDPLISAQMLLNKPDFQNGRYQAYHTVFEVGNLSALG